MKSSKHVQWEHAAKAARNAFAVYQSANDAARNACEDPATYKRPDEVTELYEKYQALVQEAHTARMAAQAEDPHNAGRA